MVAEARASAEVTHFHREGQAGAIAIAVAAAWASQGPRTHPPAGQLFEAVLEHTTCAIVGGLVPLSAGRPSLPPAWLAAREPLQLRA